MTPYCFYLIIVLCYRNENMNQNFRFNNPKQCSNWIILVSFCSSHLGQLLNVVAVVALLLLVITSSELLKVVAELLNVVAQLLKVVAGITKSSSELLKVVANY